MHSESVRSRLLAVTGLVAVAGASPALAGCESCQFSFGGRPIRVLVMAPSGIEPNVELCVTGPEEPASCRAMRAEPASTERADEHRFEAMLEVESDGPFACIYPASEVRVSADGCSTDTIAIPEIAAHEAEAVELEPEIGCGS